jgi:hypothetical protein
MKRIATTFLLGLTQAAAVDAAGGELRAGLLAGANLASLQIQDLPAEQREGRTTAVVGGVLAWRPGETWSLELRPSYVGRGARVLVAGESVELRATYLELPLLATAGLELGRARLYALAGGAIGFRTSAEAASSAGEEDIGDDFAGTDTSLRLGAGVRFEAAPAEPFLEGEYCWGLTDLNERAAGLGAGVGAIRNRGFQVRAGVGFSLGKK